jgi:hypothetical protein
MPKAASQNAGGKSFNFMRSLKELSMFFAGKDEVHKSLRRLVKRLEKAEIPYAIVGGMALLAHHYQRATTDVDILLTPEGFTKFKELFVTKNYGTVPGRSQRFVDKINKVTLDILVTGLFPGTGDPAGPARTLGNFGNLGTCALSAFLVYRSPCNSLEGAYGE